MANVSAVLKEIGKDFLECSICCEQYTNPKILSCVHSFCEKCLVKYFGNEKVKPCPVCRQEARLPVPGGVCAIQSNCFLISLRDRIEILNKVAIISDKARRTTCELCTKNEVTHHCLNCSQNICQSCMEIHKRSTVSTDHTVGTLEDIREGKVTLPEVQNEYTCNKHKGEMNRFYCETCHVLICHVCTVVDHCKTEHQYIDCAAASFKYKKILNEIVPTFIIELENLQRCLADTPKAHKNFLKNVLLTRQEVQRRAYRLRAKVTAEEDRILGEIQALKEDRNTTCEEHMKTMTYWLQRKQHTLTMATDVTTKGSDSDFLSLFPIINQDLTFLRSYVPPEIDAKFHYLRLDHQTIKTPRSINLGVLDFGDTKWELLREVGGDWKEELKFESVSDIAALQDDKLAVTATRGRLVIFNTVGELENTIQTDGNPYGVASFQYCLVVVDDSGYVQIYDEDFTPDLNFHRLTPKRAHHMCICMKKDGTILVGHSSKKFNMITLLHRPDGSLIHTISLKNTLRFLATDSNDRVVVSGFDDNQVTVINDQGDTLVVIKPTMNGQPVSCCSGVCCDGSDIYVAVSNLDSGHIHRYDGDGMFISCIVQGLHQPAGITLTEDDQHLAVVDNDIVKIYHRV